MPSSVSAVVIARVLLRGGKTLHSPPLSLIYLLRLFAVHRCADSLFLVGDEVLRMHLPCDSPTLLPVPTTLLRWHDSLWAVGGNMWCCAR